jgi:phosphopantothenoylcysteine decarboxylase/phosphopantothenate--cysteine ligase
VHTQVWDDAHLVPHVKLGQEADLVFVRRPPICLPGRRPAGRRLLTNVLLTAAARWCSRRRCTEMLHPATQANVATLRQRGAV